MVETWVALDIKSCWRVIPTVVLNRGDSANNAKRAATYPNTNTDTGRYGKQA